MPMEAMRGGPLAAKRAAALRNQKAEEASVIREAFLTNPLNAAAGER